MIEYFNSLNISKTDDNILEMEKYAKDNDIPIMHSEGITFLLMLINLKKVKNILEIGTAIGYSSILMAKEDSVEHIDTIERDCKMYEEAILNVHKNGLSDKINLIYCDALDFDEQKLNIKYDLIFIDAAKAQYIKFFEKYESVLSEDGIIVSDNLLFHGLVENDETIESRNLRALVRKIKNYNTFLSNKNDYVTYFISVGDGVAVSRRKK